MEADRKIEGGFIHFSTVRSWPLHFGSLGHSTFSRPWNSHCNLDMKRRQHSATVNYSEEERTETGGMLPTQQMRGRERRGLALIRESDIRSKLVRKLSDANQQIRQLKKEVQEKDDKMFRCRSELASMELELQVLVNIAQEIAKEGGKPGTPKINGRYIHSHLAYRLEEMQKLIFARIKDVDMVRTREVDIAYYGMAEDVRVMGSFDGWTYGEQMSPESTSMYTRFTSTIKLRPGRYEIKFLVDGEWQLSSELPMSGEGVTMNNLLIVD
ncbi:unnamed protein product [Sphagnum troendelagicum]|uniref:AMP-activated protein kinase glycogen-binding domain-containing protein n=1 Tax=Sphagnum troendelagicum TaxID=128251 RepID=A0ABP0U8L8_9BRYO